MQAEENTVERFGLYVTVSDINRSQVFYEQLFGKKPYVKNDRFLGFDVASGLYAIFLETGSAQKLVRGNSAIPYLKVNDAKKEFERVKKISNHLLDEQIVREGPLELFRFADPDGNVIEFFSLVRS